LITFFSPDSIATTNFPTSTIRPHTTSSMDPCSSYATLPDYESRFIQNIVNETSSFIDDYELPERWYRAGNSDIPGSVPNLYHCGTLYPGFLTGSVIVSKISDITFNIWNCLDVVTKICCKTQSKTSNCYVQFILALKHDF
jgi:hypothetical protein